MASGFIVKRNEKEQGPFSAKQLKKLAEKGQLRETDLVRKEDSQKFYPAEKVKGLFHSTEEKLLVAEVVEVIGEEPELVDAEPELIDEKLVVLETVNERPAVDNAYRADDFDPGFEDDYEDYDVGDYEDYEDYEDYDSPGPRNRRPRNRRPAGSRRSSSGRSSIGRGKPKRSDDDDDEMGPWELITGGVGSIAIGVMLFFYIGPQKAEFTGYGIVVWLAMLLNKIGGRWAILVFFALCGMGGIANGVRKIGR